MRRTLFYHFFQCLSPKAASCSGPVPEKILHLEICSMDKVFSSLGPLRNQPMSSANRVPELRGMSNDSKNGYKYILRIQHWTSLPAWRLPWVTAQNPAYPIISGAQMFHTVSIASDIWCLKLNWWKLKDNIEDVHLVYVTLRFYFVFSCFSCWLLENIFQNYSITQSRPRGHVPHKMYWYLHLTG